MLRQLNVTLSNLSISDFQDTLPVKVGLFIFKRALIILEYHLEIGQFPNLDELIIEAKKWRLQLCFSSDFQLFMVYLVCRIKIIITFLCY